MSDGADPRILVIRRRYLGDIVLLGPLLRNLRLRWPGAHLAVLGEAAYLPVLGLNPDVDAAWAFPRRTGDWPRAVRALRAAAFTHVLDLDNRDKTALLARATGARARLTLRHVEPVHFPWLYTHDEVLPAAFLDGRHITDLYLRPLEHLGVPVRTRECRLVARPEDVAAGRRLLGGARLLVHPGSRSAWRVWPPERFAVVLDAVHAATGAPAALVAGPGERETVEAIARTVRSPVVRIDEALPIPALAGLFAAARVLLCHDSGPMHLAAAVGTRVVALFGSQPRSVWRPLGEGHATLQAPLPCVDCVAPDRCAPHDAYHNLCVRRIAPDAVAAAVAAALAG